MNKKINLFLIASGVVILILLIFPFFNTGIKAEIIPKESIVILNNKKSNGDLNEKLPSGNYKISVSLKGYEKYESNVKVGIYGKTKISISLKRRDLIPEIPYYPSDDSFWIEGRMENGFNVYEVHYLSEKEKINALNWLKSKRITDSNSYIKYIVDGD